jgi:hypothetical protein
MRGETGKASEMLTHQKSSWWWYGEVDDKSTRLQIQSQTSASLPLQLRGDDRSIIGVHVWVSIRLGLYITCTPSLYLPPCTSIYTPTMVQSMQHKILGFYIFQSLHSIHQTIRDALYTLSLLMLQVSLFLSTLLEVNLIESFSFKINKSLNFKRSTTFN